MYGEFKIRVNHQNKMIRVYKVVNLYAYFIKYIYWTLRKYDIEYKK